MMKIPAILFFIFFCFTANTCLAQCQLKKVKSTEGTLTEAPENYWYLRDSSSYHGIAVKCLRLKQKGVAVVRLNIKYTSTANYDIKDLKFTGADSTFIICPLTLLGKQKIDDPLMNTRIYRIRLNADNLKFLTLHQLKSINISKSPDGATISIPVYDDSFLMQQLNCLQKLK